MGDGREDRRESRREDKGGGGPTSAFEVVQSQSQGEGGGHRGGRVLLAVPQWEQAQEVPYLRREG